jgi:uncharacterized membrane protein
MGLVKRALLYLMAAFYLFAGVMHFLVPRFYVEIMPRALPWPLFLVYLSGACEIALGLLVLAPRTRRLAAWGIILLLVAVFPANVNMAANRIVPAGLPLSPLGLWLRLPFQAVFIAWAYWYTRPARPPSPAA